MVIVAPLAASAQEGDISFPLSTSGHWEGLLDVSGHMAHDYEGAEGFNVGVTDVIGSTQITLEFQVGEEGGVSGSMPVRLEYFEEVAGRHPAGDPFHDVSDHRTSGTLILSGDAARLVARGSLLHEYDVYSSGELVLSGSKDSDVEWVFAITEADCLRATGTLIETSGRSFMNSVLLPPVYDDGAGTIRYNELVARLEVWPTSDATPEAVQAALDEVIALADGLKGRELPEASHMLELVDAWTDLVAEVSALSDCETAHVSWVPHFDRAWLVLVLQTSLDTALESPDHYEASELIDLWNVGKDEDAMDGELVVDLLDAFHDKLDEAIEDGDGGTIGDILAFAAANGYPELEAKAKAAAGGGS
jgi:hypothetical protein